MLLSPILVVFPQFYQLLTLSLTALNALLNKSAKPITQVKFPSQLDCLAF
jgi:hypothetical protein